MRDSLKTRRGRRRRRQKQNWLRRALLLAAGTLLAVSLWMLVDYLRQGQAIRQLQRELQAQVQTAPIVQDTPVPAQTAGPAPAVTPEPAPAMAQAMPLPTPGAAMMPHLVSVFRQNNDLVGWLKADAFPAIDYPVVQRDNWFYVTHDFYGRPNVAGTVFLDEENSILPQDQNLILHGHNMKNGTMFGRLARLLDREVVARNPFFTFSTLYWSETYVPYAVTLSSIDPGDSRYFSFLAPTFSTPQQAENYAGWLRQMSQWQLPVSVSPEDRLLTLVTCHGQEDSQRLIVALRALRPGEDQEQLAAAFQTDTRANH